MSFDHENALEIGRIVAGHQWPRGYDFYGSEYALDLACAELKRIGIKKMFFVGKRDFVVDSILYIPIAFVAFSKLTVRLSFKVARDTRITWLGTGQLSPESCNDELSREGPTNPSLMLFHIEVSPIFDKVLAFLEKPSQSWVKQNEQPEVFMADGNRYRIGP